MKTKLQKLMVLAILLLSVVGVQAQNEEDLVHVKVVKDGTTKLDTSLMDAEDAEIEEMIKEVTGEQIKLDWNGKSALQFAFVKKIDINSETGEQEFQIKLEDINIELNSDEMIFMENEDELSNEIREKLKGFEENIKIETDENGEVIWIDKNGKKEELHLGHDINMDVEVKELNGQKVFIIKREDENGETEIVEKVISTGDGDEKIVTKKIQKKVVIIEKDGESEDSEFIWNVESDSENGCNIEVYVWKGDKDEFTFNKPQNKKEIRVEVRVDDDNNELIHIYKSDDQNFELIIEEFSKRELKKLDKKLETDLQTNALNDIKLYPNPSNGQFTIEMPQTDEEVHVKIYDMGGKIVVHDVFKETGSPFKANINLADNQKGNFILTVQSGDKVTTRKMIVK